MGGAQQDFDRHNFGRAIQQYQAALQVAPTPLDVARIQQQIGMSYDRMGAPREAESHYRDAMSKFQGLLHGPNADLARQAISNIRAQLHLLEPE
jgi:tetratricopeptide (TPR) repeat protein